MSNAIFQIIVYIKDKIIESKAIRMLFLIKLRINKIV